MLRAAMIDNLSKLFLSQLPPRRTNLRRPETSIDHVAAAHLYARVTFSLIKYVDKLETVWINITAA